MPLEKQLQQLNIPEREAKVYIELLKLGLTTVGPIVSKTKLHRMMVYQALERLKDMRMASMVMKNHRQHWQVTNPSIILEKVKKQENLAETVVKELETLRSSPRDELSVQIFYGQRGFRDNLEALMISAGRTDKILRVIAGVRSQEDFENVFGDWYQQYKKVQSDQGVVKHLIGTQAYLEQFGERFKNSGTNLLRITAEAISWPTFTRITPEIVSIEVYSKEPVIIQIQNTTIAGAYIERFELMWNQAEQV